MSCTGSLMAAFEVSILIIGMLLGQYLGIQYGFWVGLISSLLFTIGGITIFHRWWWGQWPFIRKLANKNEDNLQ